MDLLEIFKGLPVKSLSEKQADQLNHLYSPSYGHAKDTLRKVLEDNNWSAYAMGSTRQVWHHDDFDLVIKIPRDSCYIENNIREHRLYSEFGYPFLSCQLFYIPSVFEFPLLFMEKADTTFFAPEGYILNAQPEEFKRLVLAIDCNQFARLGNIPYLHDYGSSYDETSLSRKLSDRNSKPATYDPISF